VVPAHNEERLLPACLASIDRATGELDIPVTVTVVLDACTDTSRRVVPAHVGVLERETKSVGAARRAGFAPHLEAAATADTWFATTDADSEVPQDWLVRHIESADAGSDVFVGTVRPTSWESWSPSVAAMFAERYVSEDGHHHVHGANLGVRADWYHRVGGFAERSGDEDVDLVRRLRSRGAAIDRSGRASVLTSTRADGRADTGFAAYLYKLEVLARSGNSGPDPASVTAAEANR
jgi:GT2 family glycosyltransferase